MRAGVGGEVVQLLRVVLELEQLRWVADVMAVLPGPEPVHRGAAGRADRVVLAEHGPRRHAAVGQVDQRMATGQWQGRRACRLQNGDGAIDVAGWCIDQSAAVDAGAGQHQGHASRFLVQRGLSPQAARAQVVTMVAGVQDQGAVRQACRVECRHHLAHLLVHERHQAAVSGDRPAHVRIAVKMRPVVVMPMNCRTACAARWPRRKKMVQCGWGYTVALDDSVQEELGTGLLSACPIVSPAMSQQFYLSVGNQHKSSGAIGLVAGLIRQWRASALPTATGRHGSISWSPHR